MPSLVYPADFVDTTCLTKSASQMQRTTAASRLAVQPQPCSQKALEQASGAFYQIRQPVSLAVKMQRFPALLQPAGYTAVYPLFRHRQYLGGLMTVLEWVIEWARLGQQLSGVALQRWQRQQQKLSCDSGAVC